MEPPPSPSPNPNFSTFPARPISGPADDHIQEPMLREFLTDLIRQEIFVGETTRRRDLIAEVIHEMTIEIEVMIRKLTKMRMLLGRTISCSNNRNLPDENNSLLQQCAFREPRMQMHSSSYNVATSPLMQLPRIQKMPESAGTKATSVMESNKDNLFVVDRPDCIGAKRKAEDTQTNLERAKRKAEAPYVVGDLVRDHHLFSPGNNVKGKWSCDLCKIIFTSETNWKQHLQGKKHKDKEATTTIQLSIEKQVETVECKPNRNYKFWCDICRVGSFCQTVMNDHISGKKHRNALQNQNKLNEITSRIPPREDPTKTVVETGNAQGHEVDETTIEGKNQKKLFWCEICNIRTYSLRLMEGHKLGKKHKAALEKQHKLIAVSDTKLTSVADRLTTVPVIAHKVISGYRR